MGAEITRLARFGLTLHPDKTRLVDFRPQMTGPHAIRRRMGPASTSSASPILGTVAERQEHGQAGHGQEPFCPCSGRGERLVSETPTLVHPRPASPPVINDAGPLRLLRRWRQHSTIAMVRPSSGADMAEVAVSARSPKRRQMDTPQRNPETPSSASSQDRQRIRHRERISLVKNRMREFRTSGSVSGQASRQRQRIGGDFLNLCRRESSDGGDSWPRRRLRSRSTW